MPKLVDVQTKQFGSAQGTQTLNPLRTVAIYPLVLEQKRLQLRVLVYR